VEEEEGEGEGPSVDGNASPSARTHLSAEKVTHLVRAQALNSLEAVLGRQERGLGRAVVEEVPDEGDGEDRHAAGREEGELVRVKLGAGVRECPDDEGAGDGAEPIPEAVPGGDSHRLLDAAVPARSD